MILGIGNDIVDVNRIHRLIDKFGDKFIKRVFTDEEGRRAGESSNPAAVLAKRFAAKEAAWKALGDEKKMGIGWKDLRVFNSKAGKPILKFEGEAAKRLYQLTPKNMVARLDLSISDEPPYAQAFVIISADTKGAAGLDRAEN